MTEHEKLKEIADKIGYDIIYPYNYIVNIYYDIIDERHTRRLDVREIIFTPEFMNKYKEYAWKFNNSYQYYDFLSDITLYLDNPVDYLFNLIKE